MFEDRELNNVSLRHSEFELSIHYIDAKSKKDAVTHTRMKHSDIKAPHNYGDYKNYVDFIKY